MAVDYKVSRVNRFDLKEVYYYYELALKQTMLALAMNCSMTVKGFKSESATQVVATQEFKFKAGLI
jgi:hypothetical protein